MSIHVYVWVCLDCAPGSSIAGSRDCVSLLLFSLFALFLAVMSTSPDRRRSGIEWPSRTPGTKDPEMQPIPTEIARHKHALHLRVHSELGSVCQLWDPPAQMISGS